MQKLIEKEVTRTADGGVIRTITRETLEEGCDGCGKHVKCCKVDPKDHMNQLTLLALLNAARMCVNRPGFRTGVFTQTSSKCCEVFRELLDSMDDEMMRSVLRVSKDTGKKCVQFKNGSYITVLDAYQNFRGYTFDYALYDDDIEDETVERAMRWAVRPMEEK